jgi:hypothetical protein
MTDGRCPAVLARYACPRIPRRPRPSRSLDDAGKECQSSGCHQVRALSSGCQRVDSSPETQGGTLPDGLARPSDGRPHPGSRSLRCSSPGLETSETGDCHRYTVNWARRRQARVEAVRSLASCHVPALSSADVATGREPEQGQRRAPHADGERLELVPLALARELPAHLRGALQRQSRHLITWSARNSRETSAVHPTTVGRMRAKVNRRWARRDHFGAPQVIAAWRVWCRWSERSPPARLGSHAPRRSRGARTAPSAPRPRPVATRRGAR